MRYLSVCSGIESATVAWHGLGWTPLAFSEIEPFPCKVLAHHYPHVPNLGDMNKFKEWPDETFDVLVGGTPCQSFSIAGLRKGLEDPRGNLMLTYLAIAGRYKPKWVVWENVPGVLSSNDGRDFGTFLKGLEELGYGFAYRVLDAQYGRTYEHPRAVPQRRRRVFVVGCLGDWGRAAGVLFDSESLRGNPPPSRKKREDITRPVARCLRAGGNDSHSEDATTYVNVSHCLTKGAQQRYDYETETFALAGNTIDRAPENGGNGLGVDDSGAAYIGGIDYENNAHGMDVTGPLMKGSPSGGGRPLPAVVFCTRQVSPTITQNYGKQVDSSDTSLGPNVVHQQMRVRRLTPLECERLMGYPDNYTDVPGASNTARYKALGNSMAVNCMRILGDRLNAQHYADKAFSPVTDSL